MKYLRRSCCSPSWRTDPDSPPLVDWRSPGRPLTLEITYAGLVSLFPSACNSDTDSGAGSGVASAGTAASGRLHEALPRLVRLRSHCSQRCGGLERRQRTCADQDRPRLVPGRVVLRPVCASCNCHLCGPVSLACSTRFARTCVVCSKARLSERERIARELHDTLLQGFQGLMFRLQAVRQLLPERPGDAGSFLDSAMEAGRPGVGEGRDAVQSLRSSSVDERDLATSVGRTRGLSSWLQRPNECGLNIACVVEEPGFVSSLPTSVTKPIGPSAKPCGTHTGMPRPRTLRLSSTLATRTCVFACGTTEWGWTRRSLLKASGPAIGGCRECASAANASAVRSKCGVRGMQARRWSFESPPR